MNILVVAHERRAAEGIASALRRISPQVRLTWAQTRASALDWLRDNRDAQAVLVDAGVEDARGPAFLEQIRTLGVSIPIAVVAAEHLEWLGASVMAGRDEIRGQERRRAGLVEERLNRICTGLQERLFELEADLSTVNERHGSETAALTARIREQDALHAESLTRSNAVCAELRERVLQLEAALQSAEEQHKRLMAESIAAHGVVEAKLSAAQTSHERAAADLAAATGRCAALDKQLAEVRASRSLLNDRLTALEAIRQRTEARHAMQLTLLKTDLGSLKARHDAAVTENADTEERLRDTAAALKEARARIAELTIAFERTTARAAELDGALADAAGAKTAAEVQLADAVSAHLSVRQRLESELEAQTSRAAALQGQLAEENAVRTTLEKRLADAERDRQLADAEHAQAMLSLSDRLVEIDTLRDRAVERSASLESQLAEVVSAHHDAEQHWRSELVAAAEHLARRESEFEVILGTEVAARVAAEQRLTDAETAHTDATQRAATALAAAAARQADLEGRLAAEIEARRGLAEHLVAAQAAHEEADADHARTVESLSSELADLRAEHKNALEHTARLESQLTDVRSQHACALEHSASIEARLTEAVASHQAAQQHWDSERVAAAAHRADLERRLAEETATRITVEERLAASDHARQQAESDHARAAEWLNTQLSDLRAEHDRAVELTATLESQLTETATAHQHAQQHWEMELAAAAERLASRESGLGHALAEEAAARSDVERSLADVEDAYAQAQQQAAADRAASAARQADLESRLHHATVAHATLEQQLAAAHAGRHEADQQRVREFSRLKGDLADLQARYDALVVDVGRLREERDGVRRQLNVMQLHASALRHQAERAGQLQLQLAESQKEVRRQFERAPYGLFECTRGGEIIRVNNVLARLLGYRGADLPRADFVATLFECGADLQWLLERVEPTGNVQSIETTLRTRDRRRLSVCLHALTSGGSVVIAVEDLTKLSVLEQRVRDAERLEAVGRVASEVAVTCDTLLRDVTLGGQRWLAAFESDASLRQQGELLLGDVTRAAGLLRQFAVYGHTQLTNVEPVSVQRVLHNMRPVLERVLGDDVELTLPKITRAIGTFDVDVEASRVERILVNVANYARERMPQGGQVKIHLATTVVDQRFLARHPKVRPGAHVLITISQVLGTTRPALPVQWPATDVQGPATLSAMEKPGMDLGPLMALIGNLGGHLWMSVEPGGNVTLQIHLPRRMQGAAIETAVPGPLASRGRQLAKWFRH